MKKNKINRILSFILSVSLISGDIMPAVAAGTDEQDQGDITAVEDEADFEFIPGYVEVPGKDSISVVADGTDLWQIEKNLVDGDDEYYEYSDDYAKATDSAFPYSYVDKDSLTTYLSTNYPECRNQNPYGSCWAHSAMGLAEFYMINHNMADKSVDYSELHLVNYTYHQGTPSIAGDTGDTVSYNPSDDQTNPSSPEDKRNILNAGGNLEYAALTLLRQRGVVLESDVPYSNAASVIPAGTTSIPERKNTVYLRNAMEISFENPDLIKECIVKNGIVGVSIYAETGTSQVYYNKDNNSYYCNNINDTNHAVSLVGWDDNYPRSNFNITPATDGAWLVRNSWNYSSTDMFSYYEYFWISYCDASLTEKSSSGNVKSAWTYEMMPADEYPGNSYYYDSQIHRTQSWECDYAANIFKASSGAAYESIEAVNFQAKKLTGSGTGYEIRIYTGVDPSKGPSSGTLQSDATTTGTLSLDGLYTITLKNPVRVKNGEYFSVVVKRDDNNTVCCEYLTPYTIKNGVSMSAGAQSGQSFCSSSGRYWTDVSSQTGNFVIGALTSDVSAEDVDESSISISPTTLTLTYASPAASLTATAVKKDGTVDTAPSISWSSSNSNVATVNNGTVTGKANGTATITAAYLDKTATCAVTVNLTKPKAAKPTADPSEGTLYIGDTITFGSTTSGAKIYYTTNGTTPTDSSTLSNGKYVIPSGVATGSFTLKLRAYADGYDASDVATFSYTIGSKAGVVLNKNELQLSSVNYSAKLTADVYGDDGELDSSAVVTWTSSNRSAATVDSTGTVTAVGSGTTTITAKSGTNSASCLVTVSISKTAAPQSDKTDGSILAVGDTVKLSCATSGADIYYTINGSDPTKSSTKYTSAGIAIGSSYAGKSITIKARAYADHYEQSGVAEYSYTVENKAGVILSVSQLDLTSSKPSAAITAKVMKEDGTENTSATISWSSSNSKAAVVKAGVITAVGTGTADITAASGSLKAVCKVNVVLSQTAKPVADISDNEVLSIGDVITPECATTGAVIYYTLNGNDPDKTSLSLNKTIKIGKELAAKTVTLKLRAYADHYTASEIAAYTFKVKDGSKIELSAKKISFTEAGEEKTLTATVYDAAGDVNTGASVTWSSSDTGVATVKNGTVKAVASGNAVITAKYGTLSAECEVAVVIVEDPDPSVSSNITVDPVSISFNGAGKTQQLNVTVEDQYGVVIENPDLKFASSDTKVATVTKGGLVTSVSSGNARITVTSGTVSTDCLVSVILPKAAKPVAEQSEEDILKIGSDITVKCSTEGAVIRYTTDGSVPSEMSPAANRKIPVTTDMAGKTFTLKLRAFANGYEMSDVASYTYKVEDRSAVELSETKISFTEAGQSRTLKAVVYDAAGEVSSNAVVSWSSSDTKVAVVDNGKVTAVASGNAVIRASYGNLTAQCDVTVVIMEEREPAVSTNILITPEQAVFDKKGQTQQLKVTVEDQYGLVIDAPVLEFSSSNTGVATVDNSGLVKAVADGDAVITVKSGDVSGVCNVTVKIREEEDPVIEEESYNVSFKVNGVVVYTASVKKGYTLSELPAEPEGNFLCWTDEETGAVWNTSSPVYRDIVLVARFAEEEGRSAYETVPDLTEESLYLVKGQKVQLDNSIKWSSNSSAVVVSKKGLLTAKAEGTASITSEDGLTVYSVYVIKPYYRGSITALKLLAGQDEQLELVLGGYEDNYPVAWYSSNPSVASVTGGRVYAIAKGNAVITSVVNGKAYTCKVKVSDKENIKFSKTVEKLDLVPMQTVNTKLKGEWSCQKGLYSSGSGKKAVYYNSVVYITASGKITAIGAGTAELTTPDGKQLVVTVSEPVAQIQYIAAGKNKTLKYTSVKNAKGSWDSSDKSVVTVDGKGKLKTISTGMAQISCTYNPYNVEGAGFTYVTKVYVENPDLSATEGIGKIKGNNYKLELAVNDSRTIKYSGNSTYAVYQPVVYKSNKPAVAFVDEDGVIHACSAGTAKLTAKINGKSVSITVYVK